MTKKTTRNMLERIAKALERMAPPRAQKLNLHDADAFIWHPETRNLAPVYAVKYVPLDLLYGIDLQKATLLENTARFCRQLPANNALLWGAKGSGKSSIVKSIHGHFVTKTPGSLKLIEIHREDLQTMPELLSHLKQTALPCIIFCDDLSFESQDSDYKSLKAVLEGGLEGRPNNILFYATSNRRHLMPREMIDNEKSTSINPAEVIDEKVSLSDRFGLWLGFHNCDQAAYFTMIERYVEAFDIPASEAEWQPLAREWSVTRGARSGRIAWQFIQDLAARYETKINLPTSSQHKLP